MDSSEGCSQLHGLVMLQFFSDDKESFIDWDVVEK